MSVGCSCLLLRWRNRRVLRSVATLVGLLARDMPGLQDVQWFTRPFALEI